MKKHPKLLRLLAALLVVLTTGLQAGGPQGARADLKDEVANKVLGSVVSLTIMVEVRGRWEALGGCSGTIISPDGYILTNSHCVNIEDPQISKLPKIWQVGLTVADDEPPVASYHATVAADKPELDLAVLRISHDLTGKQLDSSSLNLPYLELGDSDKLKTRQSITIFGYPGVGFETITITTGKITGFLPESGYKRAWIKTDAAISGGNSGGTAVDDDGRLIGVPTSTNTECRHEIDSNGDGRIDERDYCRATGNPVNFVRSINLAKPIIEQAKSGLGTEPTPTPKPDNKSTGRAAVSRLIFSNSITDGGDPVSVVTSLPSGSRDLVLFFDYVNFASGATWQPRLFIDGKEVKDQWQPSQWDAETDGNYGRYPLGFIDTDLPDGTYKFQIDYNGKSLGSASIKIGGRDTKPARLSNITFAGGEGSGATLPAGIKEIKASFSSANMKKNQDVKSVWYKSNEGKWTKVGESTQKWSGGASSKGTATLTSSQPLTAGLYRLELLLSNKLAATADLSLAGGSGSRGGGFGPVVFAADIDASERPVNPGTKFTAGITKLYYFFDYQGMEDGLTWGVTWLIDGKTVLEDEAKWDSGASGTLYDSISLTSGDPLPDGKYEVRLSLGGKMVQSATATIGSGQAPATPTPAPTGGVKVTGKIVDAITGKPVPGAVFGVLVEGVTWSTFNSTDEEVLGEIEADRNGKFTLKERLQRGKSYSIAVLADGYNILTQDGFTVPADSPDVLNLTIEIQPSR